jgi:hypothetical protein
MYFVFLAVCNHNSISRKLNYPEFMCTHQSACVCVCTFRYPARINAIVKFLPYLLQHFRCDGLWSMIDSVPEILAQLRQWGYINHVLHIPPQEKITWNYAWGPGWPPEKGGIFTRNISSPLLLKDPIKQTSHIAMEM